MNKYNISFIKSKNNSYDSINEFYLNNNLKTFILNKYDLNNYGCLLIINTGSYYENVKGLAHLLEHVLYSNKKYFDKIKELSTGLNGFTSNIYTGYYFTSNKKEIFYELIKYFSNLFINPNFDKETILNEIENVNSEFLLDKNEDHYIYNNILKLNIIKDYNYKFSIGNKETLLNNNIFNNLKNFFEKYYYAENMNLFIFNKDKNIIDEIKFNLKCFEQIKTKNKIIFDNNIFNQSTILNNLNKCYKINENNFDKTGIIILFYSINIKDFNIFYFYFLRELINRNFNNSLFDILKSNNLITDLYFNICDITKYYIIIKLEFKQTYYGTKHEDIILTAFMKYLEYIKQNINENYYNIYKNCYILNNIYDNKNIDIEYYISLINYDIDMTYFTNLNLNKLLNNVIIYNNFNKKEFNELIDKLDIKNSIIILNNYKYSLFKYETKYFNTKFLIEDNNFIIKDNIEYNFDISFNFIDNETNKKINSLDLKQYSILNNTEKLYYNDKIIIYTNPKYILDEKIFIKLEFSLNNVYNDMYNYFYLNLYVNALKNNIDKYINNDLLYGFYYDFLINKNKLYLIINGFNFNIEKILSFILKNIFEYELNENDFYKFKQELINSLINQDKNDYNYKLNKNLKYILFEKYYLLKNYVNKLDNTKFINNYNLKINNIKCLIQTKKNINNLLNIISYCFNKYKYNYKIYDINEEFINKEENIFKMKDIDKLNNTKYKIKSDKTNYIIDYVLLIENKNYKYKIITDIIEDILNSYFFEEFRRKKHYGYVCKVEKNNYGYKNEIITLNFIINISEDNIDKLEIIKKEIKEFINEKIINIINNINDKDLNKEKDNIINIYENNLKNYDRIFDTIILNDIKYYDKLIKICKEITKEEIINFTNELIKNKKIIELFIN